MVNETLQDIFDEFYAREAKRHSSEKALEAEIDDCRARISSLEEERDTLYEDLYDRNEEIQSMELEILGLEAKIKEYEEALKKRCPLQS